MDDRIYPLIDNPIFYTFLHDDFREVTCKCDFNIFKASNSYSYKKAIHNETDIILWVVWLPDFEHMNGKYDDPHYFTTDHFSKYFYLEQILREEKLNQLGI